MEYLQVGTRNQKYDYEICGVKLENVQCVIDIGITIAWNLKFSQHCKVAADKANRMLGFMNRNFSLNNKDTILPLYISSVAPTWGLRCSFGRLTLQRQSKVKSCPL